MKEEKIERKKEGRKGEIERARERDREEGVREEEREIPIINVKLYLSMEKVKYLCMSQLTDAPGNEAKN